MSSPLERLIAALRAVVAAFYDRLDEMPKVDRVMSREELAALTRQALELARGAEAVSDRTIRRPAEGRELESLREYREGDDFRAIDWKVTARRAKVMVRVHQPERHQSVMLMLDCGRHMAGRVAGRRKPDHAVDAALRLAGLSLDKGDRVGVAAFAREVKALLLPDKGNEHLRLITHALYRLEAALEESDYGRALDLALPRKCGLPTTPTCAMPPRGSKTNTGSPRSGSAMPARWWCAPLPEASPLNIRVKAHGLL